VSRRVILAGLLNCVLVGVACLSLSSRAQTQTAPGAVDDAWALLKKPRYIALLRHSNAPGNLPLPDPSSNRDFEDCSIQRNLDDEGRSQAARIGDEFRKHQISTVRLYSSQYCRAMDTAKLTKLGPVTPLPILNEVKALDLAGLQEAKTQTREFMKKLSDGQLVMLVTHVTNIMAIAGVILDSGQMAIVHFDPSGQLIVDGKITVP
jgi:phosphohistidine phosphatase SixA